MLFCPWDFPGKNTGVGCHFLVQEIFLTQGLNPDLPHCRQTLYQGSPFEAICVRVLVTQSCLTLCDPMDCSPAGFSVHGILQARAVEWIAIPFAIWGYKGTVYQVIPELSRGSAFPPHFCFSLPSSPHSQTTHVEKHSVPSSGQLQGLSKVWADGAEGDSAKEIIWPKVHFGKEQTGDLS